MVSALKEWFVRGNSSDVCDICHTGFNRITRNKVGHIDPQERVKHLFHETCFESYQNNYARGEQQGNEMVVVTPCPTCNKKIMKAEIVRNPEFSEWKFRLLNINLSTGVEANPDPNPSSIGREGFAVGVFTLLTVVTYKMFENTNPEHEHFNQIMINSIVTTFAGHVADRLVTAVTSDRRVGIVANIGVITHLSNASAIRIRTPGEAAIALCASALAGVGGTMVEPFLPWRVRDWLQILPLPYFSSIFPSIAESAHWRRVPQPGITAGIISAATVIVVRSNTALTSVL